ncbi:MAG: sensor histidine kinase [Desulfobacteraceae bacterium]|nr:sensor histidine kinase [Desulfobacteraceae bacterium]
MLETRLNHNLFEDEIPMNEDELPQFPFYTTEPTVTENIFNARISRHGFEHSTLWLALEKYRKENERLKRLIQKTAQNAINAMENDRKTVARDIHDSIGGSLAAIKFFMEFKMNNSSGPSCEKGKSIEQIISYLKDTITETRSICHQLNPGELENFQLTTAISKLIKRVNQFYPKINVDFELDLSIAAISEKVKTVVYRIVQEALNNIGKHSKADAVKINLTALHNLILLKVEDNGCGFDIHTLEKGSFEKGSGMRGMKDRIDLCEGTFQVQSKPGKGTMLSATIPNR